MSSALAGIRVLDLTNVLAGPFCAYQLALLGADVIKVEVPDGGDLARQLGADRRRSTRSCMGASFLAQNAGKKSVTLNLKNAEGKDVLQRLVETADVLVENFRPGVMARLGLGYESSQRSTGARLLRDLGLRPGRADEGRARLRPDHPGPVGNDEHHRRRATARRCAVGYPVADTIGGITAAFAICERAGAPQRTGEGAFIDVSMLDSALAAMGWVVSNYLIAGVEPQPHGQRQLHRGAVRRVHDRKTG